MATQVPNCFFFSHTQYLVKQQDEDFGILSLFCSDLNVLSDLCDHYIFYPMFIVVLCRSRKKLWVPTCSINVKSVFFICVILQGYSSHICTLLHISVFQSLVKVLEHAWETSFGSKTSMGIIKTFWRYSCTSEYCLWSNTSDIGVKSICSWEPCAVSYTLQDNTLHIVMEGRTYKHMAVFLPIKGWKQLPLILSQSSTFRPV